MNIQFPFFSGESVLAIRDVLNDHFAQLQDKLRTVTQSNILPVTSPPTSDEPFIVRHNLGVKPQSYDWTADADVRVYATSEDRKEWDSRQIKVRCSAASRALTIEPKA